MNAIIALGLLIAYFMLSIEVYLATYIIGTFHLSFWKLSPTELRILIAIGNLVLLFRPMVPFQGKLYRLYDVAGAIGIFGMGLMLVTSAIKHTRALYREERIE